MKITQGMAGITGIRSLFVSIALPFQRSEGSKPLRRRTSISRYRSREHPSDRKNPILSGRDWGYVSS